MPEPESTVTEKDIDGLLWDVVRIAAARDGVVPPEWGEISEHKQDMWQRFLTLYYMRSSLGNVFIDILNHHCDLDSI